MATEKQVSTPISCANGRVRKVARNSAMPIVCYGYCAGAGLKRAATCSCSSWGWFPGPRFDQEVQCCFLRSEICDPEARAVQSEVSCVCWQPQERGRSFARTQPVVSAISNGVCADGRRGGGGRKRSSIARCLGFDLRHHEEGQNKGDSKDGRSRCPDRVGFQKARV
jgi:hypothetical protein